MLVNVKFFNKIIFILVFLLLKTNLYASEKDQISNQLKKLSSLEFTFNQVINEKIEKGSCLLEFPGKLKCNYFDDKEKELIKNLKKNTKIIMKRINFILKKIIFLTLTMELTIFLISIFIECTKKYFFAWIFTSYCHQS